MKIEGFSDMVGAALCCAGFDEAARDEDGDWRVHSESRVVLLRPLSKPVDYVHVWAGVGQGLAPDCLAEVNRMNAASIIARLVYFDSGDLFAISQVTREMISPESMLQAVASVAGLAETVEPLFSAMYRSAS